MSRYSPRLLILWAGFALRTWDLGAASLWIDEVATDNYLTLLAGTLLAFGPLHISSCAAAYLTHDFALILIVAQLAVLLVYQRATPNVPRRWIAAQGVAVAPLILWYLPLIIIDLANSGHLIKGVWIPQPHWSDLSLTIGNMAAGYDGSPSWAYLPALLAASVLLGIGLIATFRREYKWNLYWFTLTIPLPVIVFLASAVKPLYVDRYFSLGLPAILLLIVSGWRPMPHTALRRLAARIILLTETISVVLTLEQGRDERTDWRNLAAYIRDSYQPGDRILFGADHLREPFEYYFGTIDENAMPSLSGDDMLDTLSFARLWVVYPNPYTNVHRQGSMPDFHPFLPGISPMGDWLIAHQTAVIEREDFNGIELFLIRAYQP